MILAFLPWISVSSLTEGIAIPEFVSVLFSYAWLIAISVRLLIGKFETSV
ncbi:MAG: hypothetical protein QXG10_00565 [Candidatus Hadarchaeales archaeon]